ncbi:MFS transporter [Tepidimonas taiwanensis]|uniref:Purine efflux pump PbuE n=1 Tax=Tepidimonas taiwanensis TaxID=307486 RepID=A0A554X0P8_9BURK|nr:MFS transporter [Tepidimonas taiwanensis]TSE29404.1 Purine efflux pump PbuE [Tepidimonas taiwanensis]UBQ04761.1 MFS transporter [Tepidimonas taiwanensis]
MSAPASPTPPAPGGSSPTGPDAAAAAPLPGWLWLFAACNFVIGTGAFGMTGYLGPVAEGLGVSVSAAGQTMTVYALANAVLAPLLLALTARWRRAAVMRLALGLFAGGTLLSAAAPSLAVLMAGRVLMGAGAVFTPVAAGLAVQLATPEQRGRALSRTFLGMSLSYVLGMPYGAWVGLQWGWRWPLLSVGVAALLIGWLLHRRLRAGMEPGGTPLGGIGALLRRRDVVVALALTLLYFTGIFVVTAYMGPVQLALNPLTPPQLSALLATTGAAGVVGTLAGGWAADRLGPRRTLVLFLGCLLVAMVSAPLTAGHPLVTTAVFAIWTTCGFGLMTPQQSRLAELAFAQAPLLLSLNASMVYIGTALGSAIGGAAIPVIGLAHLPWLGAVFVAGALATLALRPTPRRPRGLAPA